MDRENGHSAAPADTEPTNFTDAWRWRDGKHTYPKALIKGDFTAYMLPFTCADALFY